MAQSTVTSYFMDGVAKIFTQHEHPLVLVGLHALRFMGVPVVPESVVDLIVHRSHLSAIVTDLRNNEGWNLLTHSRETHCNYEKIYWNTSLRLVREDCDWEIYLWPDDLCCIDIEDETRYHKIPSFLMTAPVLLDKYLQCPDTFFEPHPYVKTIEETKCEDSTPKITQGQLLVPTVACYVDSIFDRARLFVELGYKPAEAFPTKVLSIPFLNMQLHLEYLIQYACLDLQPGKIISTVARRNATILYYHWLERYERTPKFTMRKINVIVYTSTQLKQMWEKAPDNRKENPKETLQILRAILSAPEAGSQTISEGYYTASEGDVSLNPLMDLEDEGIWSDEVVRGVRPRSQGSS